VLARKFLTYITLAIIAVGAYAGIFLLQGRYFTHLSLHIVLITTIIISALISLLFRPLSKTIQHTIAIVLRQNDLTYDQLLVDFTARTANILELEKVSTDLLATLGKTLHLSCAALLIPDDKTGDYISSDFFSDTKRSENDVLKLAGNDPITAWLAKEGKPLDVASIPGNLRINKVFSSENIPLVDSRFSLLVPIISHEKMISILAIGNHKRGGSFYQEQLQLIIALTRQAGIVIENAQLYAIAKERANIDELTGLFNHRHFHQRMDEEIARSSRFGEVFSLLILDLDFFKSYNDTHGHLYGDKVLRSMGKLIKKAIRSVDMAFRYGGDEFAIILPQTSEDGGKKVANRIEHLLKEYSDREEIQITCSIGLATWPTEGVMREEIIQSADNALYFAKENGRNRTIAASTLMPLPDKSTSSNDYVMILGVIFALAAAVDAKDHYTYGHSKKVSKYATDIASALGLPQERIATIRTAGLLHDIGKIGVSDKILSKNGTLSEEDWEPIHAHPNMGVSIIKHVKGIKDCLAAIQYHHEQYDGTGYPAGLKGNNIPLDARILAVADSYDAMTSARPYRGPMSQEDAVTEIKRCSGTQFDPEIVKIFSRLMAPLNSSRTTSLKPL